MASCVFSRSAVTNQIAFDQRVLHSTSEFERTIDRRRQELASKLETLDTTFLPNCCLIYRITIQKLISQ